MWNTIAVVWTLARTAPGQHLVRVASHPGEPRWRPPGRFVVGGVGWLAKVVHLCPPYTGLSTSRSLLLEDGEVRDEVGRGRKLLSYSRRAGRKGRDRTVIGEWRFWGPKMQEARAKWREPLRATRDKV